MKWRDCRLGDVITLQRGHDLPEADRQPGDVPVVTSSGITGRHNEAKAKAPGVVTGRYGTLGDVYYLQEDYWPHNTALYVKDFKGNHPHFAAYFLENCLRNYQSDKAAVPGIDRNVLHELKVRAPSRPIQERIVETLSAYDDLIENNRRRMALLEESARQLYQEWFVCLRFPGHEHTRITNGVPEGWHNIELKRLMNVTHGFAFQGEHFSDSETSRVLVTPGNFAVGGGFKSDKLKYYSEEGPLDSSDVLMPMDLILTMTDLSKMSDTLGFPAFVPRLGRLQFLHNQRIGKVIPLVDSFPRCFYYCMFCTPSYRHHVVGAATGTSVKHTSPNRILSYSILMPKSDRLIAEFERTIEPLFRQMLCLGEANEKLRAARDLLLPRLMSGEVAI